MRPHNESAWQNKAAKEAVPQLLRNTLPKRLRQCERAGRRAANAPIVSKLPIPVQGEQFRVDTLMSSKTDGLQSHVIGATAATGILGSCADGAGSQQQDPKQQVPHVPCRNVDGLTDDPRSP